MGENVSFHKCSILDFPQTIQEQTHLIFAVTIFTNRSVRPRLTLYISSESLEKNQNEANSKQTGRLSKENAKLFIIVGKVQVDF